MATEPTDGSTGDVVRRGEVREVEGRDGRVAEIHVQGPAHVAVDSANQGGVKCSTMWELGRGDTLVINIVQLVDK